jgi:hypothetical protein
VRVTASSRRRPHGALLVLAFLAALVTAVLWQFGASGAGAQTGGALVAQPSFGAPATTFLGASPLEQPGEVWAVATSGTALARYADASGWETLPVPLGAEGQPIPKLAFLTMAAAGRTTPHGGVVVAATGEAGEEQEPQLIVRDPGAAPRAAPRPPSVVLGPNEALFTPEGSADPLLTALEAGPATRALVVPVSAGEAPRAVVSYAAGNWSREPICVGFSPGPSCSAPPSTFRALAIEAGGEEAWLLAEGAAPGEGIELFRRETAGETTTWRQQSLGPAGSLGARFAQATYSGVSIAARPAGQPLTVTPAGVWFDARLTAAGSHEDATLYYDIGAGQVIASWCGLTAPPGLCTQQPETVLELPAGQGRSFAWPPAGGGEPFGRRIVTGVGQGAILSLEGGGFQRIGLAGGDAGADQGAALSAPDEGWLGANPPLRLTRTPDPSHLQSWPVPFRRPLTAVASQPGAAVGALGSEALAVGAEGEVARYVPGQGWEPDFLLTSSGKRATPVLRAVAWPEPGRAFAVGNGAAMWVWQRATGLWEPDPAAPRNLIRANFTGIAFDPSRPSRGYAIGKQGLLLSYGRTWTQEPLPVGVPPEANLTSVAFAGSEALITYKFPTDRGGTPVYSGGVLVNRGSGWEVDRDAEAALAGSVPQRVAGLPDGGAVIASEEGAGGEGRVIERQGEATPWERAAGGPIGYPAALAAIREGVQVRAIISVAKGQGRIDLGSDEEQVFNQPSPSQPPLLSDPYPLPGTGSVLRQTASGWRDEQHLSYPLPETVEGQTAYDLPARPDPVLALLVSPDGSRGWAVGGETGTLVSFQGAALQTAGVMRYGSEAAPPSNATVGAIPVSGASVSFAIGGNAQCAGPCADLSGSGIGPDRWLRAAIGKAREIPGLRAFLYTGSGVAAGGEGSGGRLSATLSSGDFAREEAAYAGRLGSAAGALPTFAAPAETDLDSAESLSAFTAAFSGFGAPLGNAAPGAGIAPVSVTGPGTGYYSFLSGGNGGTVEVIVLDYSAATLGGPQTCWLAEQLSAAKAREVPAIVVGQRDLGGQAANAAADSAAVLPILVGASSGGCAVASGPAAASAYFFDYPEQNRQYSLSAAGRSIPAFGSGTLGYVTPPRAQETDFVGASGFLVASVSATARDRVTNAAPVSVRLVPSIGALALDATDGTLVRRSHVALFEALARRPLAGAKCRGIAAPQSCEGMSPDPYIPIPDECQGTRCPSGVLPEYTFSSSKPDIADFVARDPASSNPRNALLVNGRPVLDPSSGLLCAFNAGTTTVTISAGGLSYSQRVTVLSGTVQQPCGTTPLSSRAAPAPAAPAPPPAPAPAPVSPAPAPAPVPVPPPPGVPAAPAQPGAAPAPSSPPPAPAFFLAPPNPTPLVPIVPPPPAPAFQPTPPSGTAPVGATEDEEEDEEAYDLVSQMTALRHDPRPAVANISDGGGGDVRLALPAMALLTAVAAAASLRRPRRRGSRFEPAFESTKSRRHR